MGHVGRCPLKMQGEEHSGRIEKKKMPSDESTRQSHGRIGNRTLQQVRKASPCCAKIWGDSGARRADGRCASKKLVQAHYRGKYPPTQEPQKKIDDMREALRQAPRY